MKKIISTLKAIMVLTGMLSFSALHAATYTAVISGNWTSNNTWQGNMAPPTTINADDDIIINSGVTVVLDQQVVMNGLNLLIPGSSLTVNGKLQTTIPGGLVMNNGTLAGNGELELTRLAFNNLSTFTFTGNVMVSTFETDILLLSLAADVEVYDTLKLQSGSMTIGTGGTLDMEPTAMIVVDAGAVTTNGGVFLASGDYDVMYVGANKTSGIELATNNVNNLVVNLNSNTQTVNMGSDVTINGDFQHMKGMLYLAGYTLELMSDYVSVPGATLTGNNFSNLHIYSDTTITTPISFSTNVLNGEKLDNFEIDLLNGGNVVVNTDVSINNDLLLTRGTLKMIDGGELHFSDYVDVYIEDGGIDVALGAFDGSNLYNVYYSGTSNIGNIVLQGSGLNDVHVDFVGPNQEVILNGHLAVGGDLHLITGAIDMNGYDLTLYGDLIAPSADGYLTSGPGSDIHILSNTLLTGTLYFDPFEHDFDTLRVNFNNIADADVKFGNDVMFHRIILNNGCVEIRDGDLEIATLGDIQGGNADNYIMTEGQGVVIMRVGPAGQSAVTFPVGTRVSYSPCMINLNTALGSKFRVRTGNGVYSGGTMGTDLSLDQSIVNRSWFVDSESGLNTDMDLAVMWSDLDEVNGFDRNDAYISNNLAGVWDSYNGSAAGASNGMWMLSRNNVLNTGPFAVYDRSNQVSVEENEALIAGVYPNPTTDIVNVSFSEQGNNVLEVFDNTGRLILSASNNSTTTEVIDLTMLPAGVYTVRVTNGEKVATQQLIKS